MKNRKINVKGDLSLIVYNYDFRDEKLSQNVRIQFPYQELGGQERFGVMESIFALMNQATKDGLKHPNGDSFRLLSNPVTWPKEPSQNYDKFIRDGFDWVYEGTPKEPRTLAISNGVISGKPEDIFEVLIRSYIGQFLDDNRLEIDRGNFALKNVAEIAFDPKMPGGKWRKSEDRSVTMYSGDPGIVKKIQEITHPGQINYKVPLL